MAASTVEKAKGSLRKKSAVKNTLGSPYTLKWPTLGKEDCIQIFNEIKRIFPPVLSMKQVGKKKCKQLVAALRSKETLPGEDDKQLLKEMEERQQLRNHLAVGINEVSRGLEKNQLKLALVCRSIQPAMMTDHLLFLAANRETPVLCLPELSNTMSPLLRTRNVAAIGFKKSSEQTEFDPLVEFIIPRVPRICVPWMEVWNDDKVEAGSTSSKTEDYCKDSSAASKKDNQEGLSGDSKKNSNNEELNLSKGCLVEVPKDGKRITAEKEDASVPETGLKRKGTGDGLTNNVESDVKDSKKRKIEENLQETLDEKDETGTKEWKGKPSKEDKEDEKDSNDISPETPLEEKQSETEIDLGKDGQDKGFLISDNVKTIDGLETTAEKEIQNRKVEGKKKMKKRKRMERKWMKKSEKYYQIAKPDIATEYKSPQVKSLLSKRGK